MEPARTRFPARWEDGGVLVVDVVGEFGSSAATELGDLLKRMGATGQRAYVVDFGAVGRCGPGAARQFVETASRALPADGVLAVVAGAAARPALTTAGAGDVTGGLHDVAAHAIGACLARASQAPA
ncbi:hypothetical protein ACIBUY_24620 [Streptomyces sp. NPDC050085]|uniref:hypothetical protein n=1 Tax=Streptomyces sp. NPDC050085 TaxID=3365600 RepID=UPI003792AAC5